MDARVVTDLHSHALLLAEEIREVEVDIAQHKQMMDRFGKSFRAPLRYLLDLKQDKETQLMSIREELLSLDESVRRGRMLCEALESENPVLDMAVCDDSEPTVSEQPLLKTRRREEPTLVSTPVTGSPQTRHVVTTSPILAHSPRRKIDMSSHIMPDSYHMPEMTVYSPILANRRR